MVERQEVEALLAYVEMRMASDKVELPPSVSDSTLAALCRAWLAVDEAPVGHADTATDYGGLMWTEIHGLIDDDIHAIDGQRVRIVKEVGE